MQIEKPIPLTELVEQGIRPERVEGFLEYWRDRLANRNGSFSAIREIETVGFLLDAIKYPRVRHEAVSRT